MNNLDKYMSAPPYFSSRKDARRCLQIYGGGLHARLLRLAREYCELSDWQRASDRIAEARDLRLYGNQYANACARVIM